MRDDLPGAARLVLKDDAADDPGSVARTADNFTYRPGEPAFVLLDYDTKGMPEDVRACVAAFGGFTGALAAVCPGIAGAGYVERHSTSAGVRNTETGETYTADGRHLYLVAADGSDAKRFLYALHDRTWLNGLGWHLVGRAGQLLDRSIVDRSVFGAERLCFEAAPDLEPPLEQPPRKATVHDGLPLDTKAACWDLSAGEQRELARLKGASAAALKPARATARTAFIDEMVAAAVKRGEDPGKARDAAESLANRALRPSAVLEFADPAIGRKTVSDVLADPDKFVGKSLADPIEGRAYGQQTAKVLRRPSGEIFIHSKAHGGINYHFVPDGGERIDGGGAAQLNDFVAYMQSSEYIFMPSGKSWPAARVDARLAPVALVDKDGSPVVDQKTGAQKTIPASAWLAEHAPVEQITWAPGLPQIIRHKLITNGGWFDHRNATVLNLYRPPLPPVGDATKAGPWLAHVRRVYPDDADQMILRFAHCVQRPDIKINHGLVLGGVPGIGKDTILEPVKRVVGPWNFTETSPQQMLGRFNGFVKSVVLKISEAKDMGEVDRFKLYDHLKIYAAAPPDVIRVYEKNLREHSVLNAVFVVMTTNYKTYGITCPLTTVDGTSFGANAEKRTSTKPTGIRFTAGMRVKATAMSPRTWPSWTFQASTRKPRRPRPRPFGRSWTRTTRRKTPSSPT